MKEVEVYGLPHCSTCKKAVAYPRGKRSSDQELSGC